MEVFRRKIRRQVYFLPDEKERSLTEFFGSSSADKAKKYDENAFGPFNHILNSLSSYFVH